MKDLHATLCIASAFTDAEIISRILNGEINFFEKIMQRYNQRLYRIARVHGISEYDCDDIIQETYLQVFRSLHTFREKAKFSTWLTRILINNCLVHKRKNIMEQISEAFPYFLKNSTHPVKTPEQILVSYQTLSIVEAAINSLPVKYRTVFMMREIEDMNVHETAALLEISEYNVKVISHRAKLLLREMLKKDENKTDIFNFGSTRCDRLVDKVISRLL